MKDKKFEIGEVIRYSYQTVKDNFGFLFKIMLFFAALYALQYSYQYTFSEDGLDVNIPFYLSIPIALFTWIISAIFQIGLIRTMLAIVDKKSVAFSMLYDNSTKYLARYLFGSIYYGVIVLVGLILLVVPGIIWAYKYSQWAYLLVDENMSVREAINKSGQITNGNKMNLLLFGFTLGILTLVSMIPLLLGLLVTIPMAWIANAYIYRKLNTLKTSVSN